MLVCLQLLICVSFCIHFRLSVCLCLHSLFLIELHRTYTIFVRSQVNNLREIQALRRLSPHEHIIALEEVRNYHKALMLPHTASNTHYLSHTQSLSITNITSSHTRMLLGTHFLYFSNALSGTISHTHILSHTSCQTLKLLHTNSLSLSLSLTPTSPPQVLYDQPTGRLALVFELMDANLYELIRGRYMLYVL